MDKPRPLPQRVFLHAVLIGGSFLFLLPYVWLIGTSWKLDKEVQREDVGLLPRRPVPHARSPYIDVHQFVMTRPESVTNHNWEAWMKDMIFQEVVRVIEAWGDPRVAAVDQKSMKAQVAAGVFQRLLAILPPDAWVADPEVFRKALRLVITPAFVSEAFDQCHRYFALGKVLLKDDQYQIHDLTGQTPADQVWKVERGPAAIDARSEAGRPVAFVRYDWSRGADSDFAIASELKLPVPFEQFKRLDVSFRRDESWHELRAAIEVNGRRFESRSPKYLGEDTWWEVSFQLPSRDDKRLIPKRYVLLGEAGSGPQFDHGRDVMKLTLTVSRSSAGEALWAKGTENYRKVFEEVPFWRYLSTSVFLAVVNILGTVVSCSMTAYALARLNWPGRGLAFVLVLATLMIPPQVTMIPSFVIYNRLGWYNTLAPLWAPACLAVNAFGIFLLRQAMKGIPRDLEDAAKIDGCGFFRTYLFVALPEMKPTLAAISIFTFMYVWNDFMGPLIYVNDQRLYPLALGLFSLMAGRENLLTLVMAGALIMTLPVVLLFFLLQRYFIQGVTLTGVKG